jgi:glutathione-specific gamma-glutamylcyclotransferase
LRSLYSQDHRGTPEAPGRVVTLIERSFWKTLDDAHGSTPERVWGVAYRIKPAHVAEVKDYLDIREINGYTIHYNTFHPAGGEGGQGGGGGSQQQEKGSSNSAPIRTLVYIGTPDNDQFTGPQDPQALAELIYRSEGPSGLNKDYLLSLEKALDELSPESGDGHITDLSNRVRQLEAASAQPGSSVPEPPVHSHHEFHRVRSVDEQEETEKA